jgi:putative addiction module killer protein
MPSVPREILICQTDDGREPFSEWLHNELDAVTRGRVRARIDRIEDGLFGDVQPIGDGLSELRLDFGPGYRVYFGQRGTDVHLIRGGSKRTQVADIIAAKEFWRTHGDQD